MGPVSNHTRTELLGAWTTDAKVVQTLFHAGVPVYFVQPTTALSGSERVQRVQTGAHQDATIIVRDWVDNGAVKAFPNRYTGAPSDDLHDALSEENHYRDLASYFLDIDHSRIISPVGVRGQACRPTKPNNLKNKGHRHGAPRPSHPSRDKWQDLEGDLIPPTLAPWSAAMRSVDCAIRSPTAPPKSVSGYRFPDPGMVIYSEGRRERNLFNWLAVREATIHKACNDITSTDGAPVGVSNELWRLYIGTDFMDCTPSTPNARLEGPLAVVRNERASQRQLLVSIFGRPPIMTHLRSVYWNDHEIEWGTFGQHDSLLVREVLWDLHQQSFLYDLIAIDRHLAPRAWSQAKPARYWMLDNIFGGHDVLSVVPCMDQESGIASQDPIERKSAYRAMKIMMEAWEGGPVSAVDADDEMQVAVAYCQIFAKTMGRPPILPKQFPRHNDSMGAIPYRRML
ncbi:hypothetical protein HWV62_32479 [Athelia sp. TMB]|nr:hypothetical protein HWV62_32479 [Athelia sp. TMB]